MEMTCSSTLATGGEDAASVCGRSYTVQSTLVAWWKIWGKRVVFAIVTILKGHGVSNPFLQFPCCEMFPTDGKFSDVLNIQSGYAAITARLYYTEPLCSGLMGIQIRFEPSSILKTVQTELFK